MKGLAERTIVLIVIALMVLGVVSTLLYLGVGPFRESIKYNTCKGQALTYCASHQNEDGTYDCNTFNDDVPCAQSVSPIITCSEIDGCK